MPTEYRRIDVKIHGDAKFRELSRPQPNGQSLFIYLLTNPHTRSVPGIFRASQAILADDLEWSREGFAEAFAELSSKGMAIADWQSKVIFVPNAVRYNPPASPNVIIHWAKSLAYVPESPLKSRWVARAWEFVNSEFKPTSGDRRPWIEAFVKAFGEDYSEAFGVGDGNPSQRLAGHLGESETVSEAVSETEVPPPSPPDAGGGLLYPDIPPATAKKRRKRSQISTKTFPRDFEKAWDARPRRLGNDPKKLGFLAWRARIEEGVITAAEAHQKVVDYREWCESMGKIDTEGVMQFASFFGPMKEGYKADWKTMPRNATNGDRKTWAERKREQQMRTTAEMMRRLECESNEEKG